MCLSVELKKHLSRVIAFGVGFAILTFPLLYYPVPLAPRSSSEIELRELQQAPCNNRSISSIPIAFLLLFGINWAGGRTKREYVSPRRYFGRSGELGGGATD